MNTSWTGRSATVYQFPAARRSGLSGRRYGEAAPIDATTTVMNEMLCSDSWYHEEAIREALSAAKPGRDS
jgi:hypothetical protein